MDAPASFGQMFDGKSKFKALAQSASSARRREFATRGEKEFLVENFQVPGTTSMGSRRYVFPDDGPGGF